MIKSKRKRIVFSVSPWRSFGHFALPLARMLTDHFEVVFLHTELAVYRRGPLPDLQSEGITSIGLDSLGTYSFVRALEQVQPDVVIVHDKGWPQDRAVLHAAKHLRVPSLHIQHGVVSSRSRVKTRGRVKRVRGELFKTLRTFWLYNITLWNIGLSAWARTLTFQLRFFLNPMDYCFNHRTEVVADRACIIGGRDREFFMEKEGYGVDQLVPMGALQFEKAYAMSARAPARQILLVSQPLFEDHVLAGGLLEKERHIREIVEAAPLPLYVKPHPREDEAWYRQTFAPSDLKVYPCDYDINDAISESACVVGYFSTALVNALIIGRPIGIIRWVDDSDYAINLDLENVAFSLHKPHDMACLFKQESILGDPTRFAFNSDVAVVLVETIKNMLQGTLFSSEKEPSAPT